jgi:myo-inositol-1(or 4)-monophosphatase
MNLSEQKRALAVAVRAARSAGSLMRANLHEVKKVNERSAHDIKLELDVRCQELITKTLGAAFRDVAVLGEEGDTGDQRAANRWVVDPIDGTVNFSYGIPHACVSIALQTKVEGPVSKTRARRGQGLGSGGDEYETIVGVVYDPFCDEMWTAIHGHPARLNGRITRVSKRAALRETIVSIGFAKTPANLERTLPYFNALVRRVRKIRLMGAAALGLTYVASGRFDAYLERGIKLWDIAAGGLILECAGGEFWREPVAGRHTYRMIATNGLIRGKLARLR